jgi:hypothetical protein
MAVLLPFVPWFLIRHVSANAAGPPLLRAQRRTAQALENPHSPPPTPPQFCDVDMCGSMKDFMDAMDTVSTVMSAVECVAGVAGASVLTGGAAVLPGIITGANCLVGLRWLRVGVVCCAGLWSCALSRGRGGLIVVRFAKPSSARVVFGGSVPGGSASLAPASLSQPKPIGEPHAGWQKMHP